MQVIDQTKLNGCYNVGILWVYKLDVEDDKFIILFCQEIRIIILISTKQKTNI